ncbi:bacterial proteasome activator family protein [Actinopolyspora mortivallis]|uniref:Bacterial proteasome activator n=1 Tax=Actinopolyspora mortivallis TaxID=33906 RepID=A0A2T0GV92_ACTMO|nr:bacterial proteasome activator family protein [Actinopolyspora mortivallis]PRW63022.1 hypothetical protein CEP50_12605 [Actinopolyspora mortivallis]
MDGRDIEPGRMFVVGGENAPGGSGSEASSEGDARGSGAGSSDEQGQEQDLGELVEQPTKVMRIGTMVKQLLEEVRAAPLDEASRNRLKEIHRSSVRELEQGLAPELIEELDRLSLPFTQEETPSDSELRIAQAQLVGWLEGLFHGLQTALYAQQLAARTQLEKMRQGALPSGDAEGSSGQGHRGSPGQYL